MAYRKTEKVLAHLAAQRQTLLAAAAFVVAKRGMDGFTMDAVAARANVAVGLVYKYFPDKSELFAALAGHVLARDIAAMQAAAVVAASPVQGLADALAAFYARLADPNTVNALAASPLYRLGIQDQLVKLLRGAVDMTPNERRLAAAAVLGLLYGVYGAGPSRGSSALACQFALRGLGLSATQARRVAA